MTLPPAVPRAPRRRSAPLVLVGLLFVAYAVVAAFHLLPGGIGRPFTYLVQSVTAVVAVVALVRRGRRSRGALRRARLLIAAGLVVGALAGVAAAAVHLVTGQPPQGPSFVDLLHLAFAPVLVAALLSYPVVSDESGSRVRTLLDGGVAVCSLWFVAYALLLAPNDVGAGVDRLAALTALAYPAVDVFVLGMVLGVLVRVEAAARRELTVMACGLGLYVVSDLAYSILLARGTYRADSWVNVLAEAGLIVIVLGTLAQPTPDAAAAGGRRVRRLVLLQQLPMVAVVVVTGQAAARGVVFAGMQQGAAAAVGLLIILRHSVVLRDAEAFTRRLRAREDRLARAAYTDALTGLGNLARARDLLVARFAVEPPDAATVVLVDLDGFKTVNDTFGHAQGDALLVQVAARLTDCLRSRDEVARIGGDEFVLILDGHDTRAAQRVLEVLQQPFDVAGTPLTIGASIGLARLQEAGSPDDVLRDADLAMYASKGAGRNRITPYDASMHAAATQRMQVHRGLRRALDEGHLRVVYQPIVGLRSRRLVGVEALVRWDDPVTGPVSPELFIPLAEESGIVGEVDHWVLERTCADLAGWKQQGLSTPRVSVNVSRRQLNHELPGLVSATLRRHGILGSDLCVEVTESAVVENVDAASAALLRLRAMGVTVALDDFGTGQSSLSQLARLPVDTVKIDRSFTVSTSTAPRDSRLLTSIVGVCQALSLPVVAEGVEDEALAVALAGMGCENGQGWHLGRPLPADAVADLLAPRAATPLLSAAR